MKSKKPRFAAKILALVLSLLTLLGAMPVAFAAEGDIVTEWPTVANAIEFGQTIPEAGLKGGSSTTPGHFEYATTAKAMKLDGVTGKVKFVPDDTAIAPVTNNIPITVNKATAENITLINGGLIASDIQAGESLSASIITKESNSVKLKINSYENSSIKMVWKEADKIMSVGEHTETVICMPSQAVFQNYAETIEVDVTVKVIGSADVIEIKELPTASQIELGQTLADSVLTGGAVTKGGNPVAGTFAWKDSSIAPAVGTKNYTVVFTPDDTAVCEPQEMQVSVTTVRPELKIIEWPTITAEFRGGCSVHDIVTLEGGSANVPGKFQVSPDNKNPGKMGPADVVILFVPDDRTNYDIVEKTFTVNFEAATPEPGVGVRFGANFDSIRRKEVYISGSLGEGYNTAKDQATGTLYMVLDGEKIAQTGRLSYSHTYVSEDTIAPGEHTVYTEYVAGENDVFKSAVSHVETFVVEAFPDVTINDSTGTVVNEYKAGATVKVTAAEHEKSYYDFSGWTAEGVELTEEELAQQKISFTMPENEVNLTANYKFNFKNFVKYVFEQIGAKLMALVMQGIEWIKGLLP